MAGWLSQAFSRLSGDSERSRWARIVRDAEAARGCCGDGAQTTPTPAPTPASFASSSSSSPQQQRCRRQQRRLVVPTPSPATDPLLCNPTTVLGNEQWATLAEWLPPRYAVCAPVLAFCAARDGFCLTSLFHKVAGAESLVLIIEARAATEEAASSSSSGKGNALFGSFIGQNPLKPTPGRFYGTGEAFLFRMHPEREHYEWLPGMKSYFLHVERKSFSIGGGHGVGLWVDDELSFGWSEACKTFHNPPLAGPQTQFSILNCEVVTLGTV